MRRSVRCIAVTLALVACACGNDGPSATTGGGAGGAGASAGTGGVGGGGGTGAVAVDGGADAGADVTPVDGAVAVDVFDSTPTVAVLIDDIFGGPMVDGGMFLAHPLFAESADPSFGASTANRPARGQASPQWPVRYTFDTGLDGWEVTPVEPDQLRPVEAVAHSEQDAQGATDSGSLELRTWFAPYDTDASLLGPSEFRAFSSESGPPKNWEGYKIVAMARIVPGSEPCFTSVNLYAYAGAERQYMNSRAVYLSSQEWRPLVFDLEPYRTFGDTTQIVEFGVEVHHDVCVPP